MRLTDKDLAGLVVREGAKITARPKPEVKPEPPEAPKTEPKADEDEETQLLAELLRTQQRLADLFEKLAAAKPVSVSVKVPETSASPTQWTFEHTIDRHGDCIRTIATATPKK